MSAESEMQVVRHRIMLAALGGAASIALWALAENWNAPFLPPRLYLAVFAFVCVYSTVGLVLAGPISIARALGGALLSALPIAALVSLAGLRYATPTDLLDDPNTLAVTFLLMVVSTPFLSVWLQDRSAWQSYEALFDTAWTITVRYAAAWVFVAVFWVVIFLSSALLELVDIDLIDKILSEDWIRFALTGVVLGLGLAVVYELRQTISPYLILRLLRLLVPLVLVVIAVFLAALPFRGLSQLFGDFSAAATLSVTAIGAITLVSTALDRNDAAAVSTPGLRLATRILAGLLPLLTALVVWSVFLRVRQYGWTPDRVLAALVAVFLLIYGLSYLAAIIRRHNWTGRIRRVNVLIAMLLVLATIAWMTPLLNANRISTNNQIDRFQTGKITLDQVPLWQLAHDWGKAGKAGLDRLRNMTDHADYAELSARIDEVMASSSTYDFTRTRETRIVPDYAAELARLVQIRPEGTPLTAETFADLPFYRMNAYLDGCRISLPDGRPGCVLIHGAFLPAAKAEAQGIFLYLDTETSARASLLLFRDGVAVDVREVFDPKADLWPVLSPDDLVRALGGEYTVRPTGSNALHLGDMVLAPAN